jgi:hypothetical protein
LRFSWQPLSCSARLLQRDKRRQEDKRRQRASAAGGAEEEVAAQFLQRLAVDSRLPLHKAEAAVAAPSKLQLQLQFPPA